MLMANKKWKITETLAHGYSSESTQWELSDKNQDDRVYMDYKNLCILVLFDESSLSIGTATLYYHFMSRHILVTLL